MSEKKVSAAEIRAFLDSEEIDVILSKNQHKFKAAWAKMIDNEESINPAIAMSWNWAALLLQNYWLLHRKMYSLFFICALINIAAIVIPVCVPALGFLGSILMLCLFFFVGIFGNGIYLKHCLKLNKTAQERSVKFGENKMEFLKKAGGTTWVLPIVLCGVNLIVLYFLFDFLIGFVEAVN